jgi:hypothetical protein
MTKARLVPAGMDLKVLEREMRQTATRALDTWPDAMKDLPAPDNIKDAILSRFGALALVREVRPTMIQGHALDAEPAGEATEEPTSSFNP